MCLECLSTCKARKLLQRRLLPYLVQKLRETKYKYFVTSVMFVSNESLPFKYQTFSTCRSMYRLGLNVTHRL